MIFLPLCLFTKKLYHTKTAISSVSYFTHAGRSKLLSWRRPKQPRAREGIAMDYHRISMGFVAGALLALPSQGLRADAAPKVIEEVD